jgi:PAS domain S-box-containing protein
VEFDRNNDLSRSRWFGLVMAFANEEMLADLQETKEQITWSVVASAVAVTLLAFVFSYVVTRRLAKLTRAAESIAVGKFDVALPYAAQDEIGDLTRGFRRMIKEVQSREKTIEERELRLRMIVDGAAEGILTLDQGGHIRSGNSAAGAMFGVADREFAGRPVQEFLARDARSSFDDALQRLLTADQTTQEAPLPAKQGDSLHGLQLAGARTHSVSLELVGRRVDGSEFPLDLSLSTVPLPDQRIVTLIVRDISERKRAETQIRQLNEALEQKVRDRTADLEQALRELQAANEKAQELNRAKDAFLASVSHELRNPLNQVSGFCQLLDMSELSEEQRSDLRKIRAANTQLLALINDILDFQKIVMGGISMEPETFDVAELLTEVRDAMSLQANENRNRLHFEWPEDVGSLFADKQRTRQVLLNLVGNACKFTSDGSVTVRAQRCETNGAPWIEVAVADTGRGMTPEEQAKLFRPFTKLASRKGNKSGTGLGLVISKGFCELMGGEIRVQSESGRGSTFTVRLPAGASEHSPNVPTCARPAEVRASADAQQPVMDGGSKAARVADPAGSAAVAQCDRGRLVLVIDDDQAVREMMQRHLTSHGFSVVTAENGYEGLALARKLKPAVITLDAIMPGLDGWSVLGALKAGEETGSIPVVIVTVMDKAEHSQALGATEFLSKPIDWDRLAQVLARYTGNKRDRSVLVVDDDENVREMLRRNLEADGWSVLEAQHGLEALEKLAEREPAAVVLDLMMPVMDGFEFILRYSQVPQWLSIPVLVLTAKDPTPDEQRHLQGQVARVLRKGDYSEEELLAESHRRVDIHLRSPLPSGNGANDGKNPRG